MTISKELFIINTYDIHRIHKIATLREKSQDLEKSERQEAANELYYDSLLLDCFIYLFQTNPGFQQEILLEIANDPSILEKTLENVNKLFYKNNGDLALDYLPKQDVGNHHEEPLASIISQLIESYQTNPQKILYPAHSMVNPEFAAFFQENALNTNEFEIAYLIPYLIQYPENYHTNRFFLLMDSTKTSRVIENQYRSKKYRENKGKFKVLQNIYSSSEFKLFESPMISFVDDIKNSLDNLKMLNNPELLVDKGEWTKGDELLFGLTPILKDVRQKIAKKLGLNYCPEKYRMNPEEFVLMTDNDKEDYVIFQKFTTDVLTIAAEFWFENRDHDKKINLLNNAYSLFLNEKTLEEFNFNELDEYANRLIDYGYYDIGEGIYNYILDHAQTDIDKFWCRIAIGYCARNCFQYTKAHDNYKNAHEIISQHISDPHWMDSTTLPFNRVNRSALYWLILSNAISGEMSWHLDCLSEVEEAMDFALSCEEKISDGEEKAILHGELLGVCRNTCHHEREPAVLEILLKQLPYINSEENKRYYKNRYDFLLSSPSKERIEAVYQDQKKLDLTLKAAEFFPIIYQAMLSHQHHLASLYGILLVNAQVKAGDDVDNILAITAMAVYRIRNYELAGLLFHDFFCNSTDRESLFFYPYLGISQVLYGGEKKDDELVNIGIKNLKSAVQQVFLPKPSEKSEENLRLLLNRIASELIYHGNNVTERILDSFYDTIKMNLGSSNKACLHLATTYSSISWNAKAYQWLNKMPAKKDGYGCVYRLPYICLCMKEGKLKEAIKICEKVLTYPGRYPKEEQKAILPVLANAYYKELKFAEAQYCYQKAKDSGWIDEKNIIGGLKGLLDARVSIISIDDPDAGQSFRAAERLFTDFYLKQGENEDIDFSGYLYQLFKGVEIITHKKVGLPLRKNILNKFGAKDKSGIPNGVLYKLDYSWRGLLTNYSDSIQSVPLGTFGRIIQKEKNSKNKISKYIYTSLREKFNEDLDALVNVWKMMAPERNKIDHVHVQDMAKMLEMRKEFVGYVNQVINILYRPSQIANDAPVTITVCDSSLLLKGWETAGKKEYQKVIEIADEILNNEKGSAEAYSLKADAYFHLNQLDKAMTFIDNALEEDPDDSDNLVLKGNIFATQKDYTKALECYSKAITAYLWNDDALYSIGLTYHKIGDYGMALEVFARLKEMNPDYQQLAQGIEDAEYNLHLFQSAIEKYDDILSTNKLQSDEKEIVSVKRAIELFHVGRYEEAITEAERLKDIAKKYLENPGGLDLIIKMSHQALNDLSNVQTIYGHPYYTKDNLPSNNNKG